MYVIWIFHVNSQVDYSFWLCIHMYSDQNTTILEYRTKLITDVQ